MSEKTEKDALVANVADEEQVQQATETENRKRNALAEAWRLVVGTTPGQVLLRDLLDFCGPFESPFGVDERHTNLAIGRGDVARYMIAQLDQVNPNWLALVMQQAPKPATHAHPPANARGARSRARRAK